MLEKMTLEEFRKIKEELLTYLEDVQNTLDFNEDNPDFKATEYEQEAIKNYQNILKKLLTKDLSDIPFEEWQGIYIVSEPERLDFSQTKANLDFSLIDVEGMANFHNCQIKNLNNLWHYSDDSFDEEVIKANPDYFLSKDYPEEFRKKFYNHELTLPDFNLLTEEQIDKLPQNKLANINVSSYEESEIILKRFGLKRALALYNYSKEDYLVVLDMLKNNNESTILNSNFLGELDNIVRNTKLEEVKDGCFEWLKKYLISDEAFRFETQIPEDFKEKYPEFFPNFSLVDNPNFTYYYLNKIVSLDDLLKYKEYLKGKQYAYFVNDKDLKDLALKVGQDDFLDLLDDFKNLLKEESYALKVIGDNYVFDGDVKRSFKYAVKDLLHNLTEEERQKWVKKLNFHYVDSPTIEDLKDPDCFIGWNYEQYAKLGIANIIKLEEETHVFSLNDISILNIKCHSVKKVLSYEEFIEAFLDSVNYENLEGSFKEKYAKFYLPDNTPDDIKEKFYNHEFTPQDFILHPELLEYFANTDLMAGLGMTWLSKYNPDLSLESKNKKYIEIAKIFSAISDYSSQEIIKDYVAKNPSILDDQSKFEKYVKIILKVKKSNSLEMLTFSDEILSFIFSANNPEETYLKIEDIFMKNNLPMIAKIYNVFELMHPNCDFKTFTSKVYSPTLIAESEEHRNIIIFTDLLKAALGSNNRSLREYIENIEVGNELFTSLQTQKTSYDKLTEEERDILETFKAHLNALYNSTKEGMERPYKLTHDLKKDLETLSSLFKVTKRYDLPDRIVRSFASKAGIKSFDQLKSYFEDIIEISDKRNREASSHEFKLEEGDFIKGIADDWNTGREAITFLNNIFQNGSLSKEFLGVNADSDLTPLDTDCSIIQSPKDNMQTTLSSLAASYYGKFWFVLKNRDNRFTITAGNPNEKRPISEPGDFSKLEAFYTGPNGLNHYGIRTGFASSDIDFILAKEKDFRIGLEIAKNGFYIPVVDLQTEKVIFTPRDFDELRSKMAGLKHYQAGDYVFSSELDKEAELLDKDSKDKMMQMNLLNLKDVELKRKAIIITLSKALEKFGLKITTTHQKDLSSGIVELIDTGSTGRGTNVYGDGDFDFMMKFDQSIMENLDLLEEIKGALKEVLPHHNTDKPDMNKGNFRFENVNISGLEMPVHVDISFSTRTDKISYSTDEALKERFANIRKVSEEKYNLIVKNIIEAKSILKENHAYKKGNGGDGGLGGVGVENWILQNGGSLETAAKEFLSVAEKCQDFSEFCEKYQIWDFGENHYGAKDDKMYLHDNFVKNNMTEEGYEKMKEALKKYIQTLKASREEAIVPPVQSLEDIVDLSIEEGVKRS